MTSKVIKRYKNRKLYDSQAASYVTLHELGQMLKAGHDVSIIDNQTKNDITGTTLTQLLHEKERSARVQPSAEFLKEIIRYGDGSFSGYIRLKMATELAKFDEDQAGIHRLNQ
jgi:polyhydroxyalkanoate synthesis repressor PhaR